MNCIHDKDEQDYCSRCARADRSELLEIISQLLATCVPADKDSNEGNRAIFRASQVLGRGRK